MEKLSATITSLHRFLEIVFPMREQTVELTKLQVVSEIIVFESNSDYQDLGSGLSKSREVVVQSLSNLFLLLQLATLTSADTRQ